MDIGIHGIIALILFAIGMGILIWAFIVGNRK